MSVLVSGVYPPIATPFDENGEVSLQGLRHNVNKWAATGLSGLVVLGSNGEFPLLDDNERDVILGTVLEHAPAHFHIIVGTGRESTRATVRSTRRAAEMGAHVAIVVHPSYYTAQMTDTALYEYYRVVAGESPIPILLYNVPPFTGLNMTAALIARLAQVPNIIGVKDTSANLVQIADTVRQVPDDFAVLAGSASFLLASLAVGARGGILALANLAPEKCLQMVRAYEQGDLEEARRIQLRLLPVNAAITSRFGTAGLKAAMEMCGYYGGIPRHPLLPLESGKHEELLGIMQQAGLL